jgi:hypothetical protein
VEEQLVAWSGAGRSSKPFVQLRKRLDGVHGVSREGGAAAAPSSVPADGEGAPEVSACAWVPMHLPHDPGEGRLFSMQSAFSWL